MSTYSHSRISTFETCKLKYKYAYIDKVETEIPGSVEAFMGSRVHETLEKLYKDLQFEKLNELNTLLNFYEERWNEEWSDDIIIVKEDYKSGNYFDMGKRMITDYYNHYQPFNQAKTIGLETTDFYDLDENHKIHVRIDRLASPEPGTYEIHDYKTNSTLKTQDEADKDRQLAVYAMGVKRLFPDAKKIKLIWHMLAFDREVTSERTDSQLDELKEQILQQIKQIEEEQKFEPTKSGLCPYCEFQPICPLWKHMFQVKDLPKQEFSKDAGVILADQYSKLKDQEKTLQTELDDVQQKIFAYGEQFKIKTLFGSNNMITLWSKDAVKFPNKDDPDRKRFIDAVKGLNLYQKYSDLDKWTFEKDFDTFNQIEKQVLSNFAKKETVKRLYMRKKEF